jgi:cytochrome P450
MARSVAASSERISSDHSGAADFGIVPEPLDENVGWLRRGLRALDNELWLYAHEDFAVPFSRSRHGCQRYIMLNQPAGIRHVLVENSTNYLKSHLTRGILRPLFGESVFMSDGAIWRHQRHRLVAAFDAPNISTYAAVVTQCVEAMVERWRSHVESRSPIDIATEMGRLMIEITGKALFSVDLSSSAEDIRIAVAAYMRRYGRPRLTDILGLHHWLPDGNARAAAGPIGQIDRHVADILRHRITNPPLRKDLLSVYDSGGVTLPFTSATQERRDQIITFLLAGYVTTSAALSWTWFLLSRHPQVEQRLHEELDSVLGTRAPNFGDLGRLVYTRMLFNETLRLFPPVYTFNRVALADDDIDGRQIPAGAVVAISPYVTHRNPRFWKEPRRFCPERFLPNDAQGQRGTYFPFGMGPRTCIGKALAKMEAELIIATVAQAYRLKLEPNSPLEAQARVILYPRHGIWMLIERRR